MDERYQFKSLIWIAAVPAIAVAYYFAIALPSYNNERLALERQKYSDEQKTRATEARRIQEDAASRQRLLEACFQAADEAYWRYVKLNGTERKDGTVWANPSVWNAADKRKSDERDVCFKRYPSP